METKQAILVFLKTTICLAILVNNINAQCNLSFESIRLQSINESCGDIYFQAVIDNSIIASTDCGDINFTPPFLNDNTSSIPDLKDDSSLVKVFPNPLITEMLIELEDINKIANLKLYNSAGSLITSFQESSLKKLVKIDASSWKSGIYQLIATYKNGSRSHHSIVKIY